MQTPPDSPGGGPARPSRWTELSTTCRAASVRGSEASSTSSAAILESVTEEREELAVLLTIAHQRQLEAEAALAAAGAGKAAMERKLLAQRGATGAEGGWDLAQRLQHSQAERRALERQCKATGDLMQAAKRMLQQVQDQHNALAEALMAERVQRTHLVLALRSIQEHHAGELDPRAAMLPHAEYGSQPGLYTSLAPPPAPGQLAARQLDIAQRFAQLVSTAQQGDTSASGTDTPLPWEPLLFRQHAASAASSPHDGSESGDPPSAPPPLIQLITGMAWDGASCLVQHAAHVTGLVAIYLLVVATLPLRAVLLSRASAFLSVAAAALVALLWEGLVQALCAARQHSSSAAQFAGRRWRMLA